MFKNDRQRVRKWGETCASVPKIPASGVEVWGVWVCLCYHLSSTSLNRCVHRTKLIQKVPQVFHSLFLSLASSPSEKCPTQGWSFTRTVKSTVLSGPLGPVRDGVG